MGAATPPCRCRDLRATPLLQLLLIALTSGSLLLLVSDASIPVAAAAAASASASAPFATTLTAPGGPGRNVDDSTNGPDAAAPAPDAREENRQQHSRRRTIVVIGSVNADTFLRVDRLPREGENVLILPGTVPVENVPGGKGCTQAVAVARMAQQEASESSSATATVFVGQFGGDPVAVTLRAALDAASVNVPPDLCLVHDRLVSGRGYVFLTADGQVSAVVCGGSNQDGWGAWEEAWGEWQQQLARRPPKDGTELVVTGELPLLRHLDRLLVDCTCVLLQREVPECVNRLVAAVVAERRRRFPQGDAPIVIQDVGGEDRPMDRQMMEGCDYVVPNESELMRLVATFATDNRRLLVSDDDAGPSVVDMAKVLQSHGARNVLVTQGRRGSTLVTESGRVITQPALPVENVVDETGAGDCYRAAFAVGLSEGRTLLECMELASAAGACSVERQGAVPSAPSRADVEARMARYRRDVAPENALTETAEDAVLRIPRGDGLGSILRGGAEGTTHNSDTFPFLIGSRLNSMKDRPDLWKGSLNDPMDYLRRQSQVEGLTCVDFNYPQHFLTWSAKEAKAALDTAGLKAGAVCLRYPSKFARGAMNHPAKALRDEALQLTKEAAQVAIELGCDEVVVWSAYDGYDYPFQVDYDTKWEELVAAFRDCCDEFPQIKWSVEYKPTDENTRFFTVPSTGAALLLVADVDRPNFGLTLDVGHMLMSGENPGQSIAMACRAKKLFGVQLNDGYTRLAAEDGLIFGSVHPSMALEVMYQLRRGRFHGHLYFDTFPQRSDPIKEAEYNIRRVKAFWEAAGWIDSERMNSAMAEHDAIASLALVDEALKRS